MKRKFLFILFPVILALAPSLCLANYSYPLMEGIPGFLNAGQTADFPTYLSALYKFGIWTIGLAALLMLSVGGFIYITSAGNNSQTGKAKGIITDAIIGVVMALVSWLLLYTINPDLVKFTPLTKLPIPAASTSATGGATSAANSAAAQQQLAQCQSYCNNAGADSSSAGTTWTQNCLSGCQQNAQNAAASGSKATGGQCNQINDACNNNSSGIDPSLLKTVMAGGEGCNKNVSSDGYGSCGYSQALPNIRTACGISGTPSETCAKIQADPQLDANCAAWLIKQQGSSCGTTDAVQVGCCYNGGPSNSDCHKNPTYGTKINNYVSKYGSSTQN